MYVTFTKLHKFVVSVFLISLSSCEVINAVDDLVVSQQNKETYIISKGKHDSNNGFKKLSTSLIRFEATFDSSAVYTTVDPANQADINKLYGLSDCSTQHHTNSARFGWRWYNSRLEIHAYTYFNKQRSSELITTVELNKPYLYQLRLEDNEYVFILNDVKVSKPRNCSGPGEGYQLYPYFGGDEVAPHNIKIYLKEL
ncbi:hypothetical protein ACFSRY_17515 [Pontibacter locisalis]|uniref:Lipoprotein n=1 Tax=Pontibacter locisalis TaxID=1719035 RepID=A0ABW5IUG6_9BACT